MPKGGPRGRAKTTPGGERFNYQSDRHCSKTKRFGLLREQRLITSQIGTAPKLRVIYVPERQGLITSQIDTAPKRGLERNHGMRCLITSQIDTAPKREGRGFVHLDRLITSQINTAPKRTCW